MVAKHKKKISFPSEEVSIASTMGRTACLIVGTLFLMAIVRFCAPVSHIVQYAAGSGFWQHAYSLFHITSALGREQLMLSAIVIVCFVVTLAVQMSVLWGWQRWVQSRFEE